MHTLATTVLFVAIALVLVSGPALAAEGEAVAAARNHLEARSAALGLASGDLADLVTTDAYVSKHTGVTHVYWLQRYTGIGIQGATASVHVGPDGGVVHSTEQLMANVADRVSSLQPVLGATQAVAAAAADLGLALSRASPRVEEPEQGAERRTSLDPSGISQRSIPVRLVFVPRGEALRLAWRVEIYTLDGGHYWTLAVDAETGAVLSKFDSVEHDDWGAGPASGRTPVSELAAGADDGVAVGGGSYRVFPIPLESPNHGAQSMVADPADGLASPFGWHDTDGTAGAEFTDTRGNNVSAQEDQDANNSGGFRVDGGPGLVFDVPFDPNLEPPAPTNVGAAIVNLYYWNNIVHDIMYQYGFDEAGGNFQENNYGRGGFGGDPVQADAQDGSGTNNANFLTLPDGLDPRMQMFVWTYPFPNVVRVLAPPSIVGDYGASGAAFGPPFDIVGITGQIVLVNDGVGTSSDACEPVLNGPFNGAIVMIDRGSCTFVAKVKNAQNAGAGAVVVVNNQGDRIFQMAGSDPTIVIPSAMIGQSDGDVIKGELPLVTATVKQGDDPPRDRDSDLDNGIIVHEYGHGISNRLTGGPSTTVCLNNQEQMGEGWSDWYALAFTATAGQTATTNRGIGTYVTFEDIDGQGIRPAPYNTDMSVNPFTYENRADSNISVPHGVGFLWASMIWDTYWKLVEKHGFNPDVYGDWTSGGNNLAIQLVTDGIKLQPCSPGFVDGRNAILQADRILTGGANQCEIWEAFAGRGLGLSASQGSPLSRSDGNAAFDVPPLCSGTALFTMDTFLVAPGGVEAETFAYFADAAFQDGGWRTGVWGVLPQDPPMLYMLYNSGQACDGLWLGTFNPNGYFVGIRFCLDSSELPAIWYGIPKPAAGP